MSTTRSVGRFIHAVKCVSQREIWLAYSEHLLKCDKCWEYVFFSFVAIALRSKETDLWMIICVVLLDIFWLRKKSNQATTMMISRAILSLSHSHENSDSMILLFAPYRIENRICNELLTAKNIRLRNWVCRDVAHCRDFTRNCRCSHRRNVSLFSKFIYPYKETERDRQI